MSGPSILAVVAIVFVGGAAVALWLIGDRNANRDRDAKETETD
jgi:hypothetical protein